MSLHTRYTLHVVLSHTRHNITVLRQAWVTLLSPILSRPNSSHPSRPPQPAAGAAATPATSTVGRRPPAPGPLRRSYAPSPLSAPTSSHPLVLAVIPPAPRSVLTVTDPTLPPPPPPPPLPTPRGSDGGE
ncbi:neural Wiskott-Aldrich syndrome protein-like [Diprion similis]|uniref:neural Wiskott-Aldrich syndrome protein-like n=1 Tax=Diprion similis TaxID=362088 RepID=UPI001EF7B4E3|nr:neural Wiskott-Aldrich syndrome protein-like [Diprion similis]